MPLVNGLTVIPKNLAANQQTFRVLRRPKVPLIVAPPTAASDRHTREKGVFNRQPVIGGQCVARFQRGACLRRRLLAGAPWSHKRSRNLVDVEADADLSQQRDAHEAGRGLDGRDGEDAYPGYGPRACGSRPQRRSVTAGFQNRQRRRSQTAATASESGFFPPSQAGRGERSQTKPMGLSPFYTIA
jgi:hypothetical protein